MRRGFFPFFAILAAGALAVPANQPALVPVERAAPTRRVKARRAASLSSFKARRSRGPATHPKRRPNRKHISRRVRRRARRAA